jgi:uncharacterized protein YbjT (DUF2867 family)
MRLGRAACDGRWCAGVEAARQDWEDCVILITGASGNAGGAVLQAAMAAGLTVRAMYRDKDDAANAPDGVPAVIGDFGDQASLARVLEGVEHVYLVCGAIPQLVALESAMIEACRAAGVQHIVLNSALGAGHFPKSFPSWHTQVEDRLRGSGLGYTILRPNGFMQNIVTYNAASIRSLNAFYAAMGDARVSLIDVRDVGAVAAAILAAPERHAGKIYELSGPEAVTNGEVAARISRVVGRGVAFVDIPEEHQRQAMLGAGMPEWQVGAILELQEYYRSGAGAGVDGLVAELTGRQAGTLDAYLSENRAAFIADAQA